MSKRLKATYIVYLIVLFIIGIYGVIYRPVGTSFARGYSLCFPQEGATMDRSFTVNGNVYAKDGLASAELVLQGPDGTTSYAIEREQSTHKGKVLYALSTFKNPIKVTTDGDYRMWVRATELDGTVTDFPPRTIHVKEGGGRDPFVTFSTQHIITMLVMTVIMAGTLILVSRKKSDKTYRNLAYLTWGLIIFCDYVIRIYIIMKGSYRASYDVPFHMCDISGFLMPLLLFSKPGKFRDNLYNLMFIWGIGGALMAIVTPEMGGYAFPSYYFFNFFIKHGALVFGVLLITFMKGMRPKFKLLLPIMVISNVLIAIIYGINHLMMLFPPYEVGNYLFISYPPTGGSAIDMMVKILGPSPWYIIGFNVLGIIVFSMLWFPFKVESWIKKKCMKPKDTPTIKAA